jgi:peptidoglycan-associated lipoprotein
MRIQLVSLFAAAVLLAACESTPETTATTGGNTASTGTSTAPSTARGPVPGSKEDFVANVGDRVFFAFDKSELSSDARGTLGRQAAWLKQWSNQRLTIEGHCDERGTREYNLALGERRANAVKDYLVASGVSASRLSTISYGKERPIMLGSNEAAWAQNRVGVSVPQ